MSLEYNMNKRGPITDPCGTPHEIVIVSDLTAIYPGPNAVWHIDGYDKLAPYGIYIHSCVDGFSRKIIWLNAYKTNKDPKVIVGYYMEAIQTSLKGPQIIRADRGTENSLICRVQRFLRRNHDDGHAAENSFRYGTSTTNQRIEWSWGMNRKHGIQFWMNLFQELKESFHFSGDFLDKSLIRYFFIKMVQVIIRLCLTKYIISMK